MIKKGKYGVYRGKEYQITIEECNIKITVVKHAQFGYRLGMTAYVVDEDIAAAFGITKANPHLGSGGLPQIFVPDGKELIEKGVLKPVYSERLTNFKW